MSVWNFFDRKVVLTADDVEWCAAQTEFARVGLDGYQKFQALAIDDGEILGPHQSFSGSECQILRDFLNSDALTLLHLEDDCVFRDLSHLEQALQELQSDWDIVYLGANLLCWNNGGPQPERYSQHLFRVKEAWTTHAIGYNRKCVSFILEHQPGLSERMFDNYLSDMLPHLTAYVVAPMIAWQRPHKSTIWKEADGVTPKFTDYTDVFVASNEKLR